MNSRINASLRNQNGFAWVAGIVLFATLFAAGLLTHKALAQTEEEAPSPESSEQASVIGETSPDSDSDSEQGEESDVDENTDTETPDDTDDSIPSIGDEGDSEEEQAEAFRTIPDTKIDICHATDSNENPYVGQNPSKLSILVAHQFHNGPVWYADIEEDWGDIIPPFDYIGGSYPGKNWDDAGQAIYNNDCKVPETSNTATITAQKIVCDDESDLPNWGAHDLVTSIDSSTATAYVAEHKGCELVDWNFEWSYENVGNPGDNLLGSGGDGWNAFVGGVASIDLSNEPSEIHVREIPQEGYIPFVGSGDESNVSAEMYCSDDVLHYDNWDFIRNLEVDGEYYCVAWNVPLEKEEACRVQVVSEAGDTGVGNGNAVAAWIHTGWTHTLESVATWIWDSYEVVDASQTEAKTFTKSFYVDGPVNDATLELAADNRYWITINGNDVASDTGEFNYGAVTGPIDVKVTGNIQSGWNTITMKVENIGLEGYEQRPHDNPAAGIYKLVVNTNAEDDCKQPEPSDDTILTIFKHVIGGDLPASAFDLALSWYTEGNENQTFEGDEEGTSFDVNPGTYIVGENLTPGYTMVRGANCNTGTISEGQELSCTITNKYLPQGGNNPSCRELAGEEGWYGEYFNYPKARTDMYSIYEADPVPGDDGLGSTIHGQPTDSGADSYEWYNTPEYFRFSRVDSNLEFGEFFFPFYDETVEEVSYYSTVDYHFGVHWSATVDVPVDDADYAFTGKFDDDVWVFVNGVMDADASVATGVHAPVGVNASLHLSDGDVVDVYYAERAPTEAVMFMDFLDDGVIFHPHNDDCDLTCNPEVNLLANGGFETPDVTDGSGWDVFASGTPGVEWLVDWADNFLGDPEIANIELHGGVNGWLPYGGIGQYAELDSDWNGHNPGPDGEESSTVISQEIPTIPGATYELSYAFSPRPGTGASDNSLEVSQDGNILNSISIDGSANGNTVWSTYANSFVAGDDSTLIALKDLGTPNSVGTFVDNVALYCIPKEPSDDDGSITIIKQVEGYDGDISFDFNFSGDEDEGTAFVLSDGQNESFGKLSSGEYAVTEEGLGEGWTTEITCNEGVEKSVNGNTLTVYLGEGQGAVCTFTNTYDNDGGNDDLDENIIVRKEVTEGSNTDTSFHFDANWTDGGFSLTGGDQNDSGDLSEDTTYSVSEDVPEGWTPQGVVCSSSFDQQPEIMKDVPETIDPQNIVLSDGETVTCVFTNDQDDQTPETPGDNNNTSHSNSRRSGGGSNGRVLGASTEGFCPFLKDYLHINMQNDPTEVNKAKAFFNAYLGKALILDGVFDKDMFAAAVEFQNMFKDDVLDTWVEHFSFLDNDATGYIYQTTKWKINSIMCPGYEAFPDQLIVANGTTVNM